ncbi:MAG: hypothetical protein ABEJ42_00695 [Halobacteriaceae archaeon]
MPGEPTPSGPAPSLPQLPGWLARYARLGLAGLAVGTVAALAALLTNPVPDPSFPWFSLPADLRVGPRQPRIEHWPASYTLGVWLWIAGFPAVFLAGYRRYGAGLARWLAARTGAGSAAGSTAGTAVTAARRAAATWLVGVPTVAMVGWTTYCRAFWPMLHPPTWNAPAYTFVCWAYCSTYVAAFSDLAFAVAGLGATATVLAWRRPRGDAAARAALVGFGVLALPLGLPALFAARVWRGGGTESGGSTAEAAGRGTATATSA